MIHRVVIPKERDGRTTALLADSYPWTFPETSAERTAAQHSQLSLCRYIVTHGDRPLLGGEQAVWEGEHGWMCHRIMSRSKPFQGTP